MAVFPFALVNIFAENVCRLLEPGFTYHSYIKKENLIDDQILNGISFKQGPFEILSLSGSYLLSENGGQRSRAGGLSVSLSGPDGRVLGGGVAGLLTAAAPVQVYVFHCSHLHCSIVS